jgi:S1-C subfamily serine protease
MSRRDIVAVIRQAAWLAVAAGACVSAPAGETPGKGDARSARRRTAMTRLFEACKGSVVTYTATRHERKTPASQPGGPQAGKPVTVTHVERGTAFVIHPDGFLLTTSHGLLAEGKRRVTFCDGRSQPVREIARDDAIDVALLKADAGRAYEPLKLARAGDVVVGERVAVLGDPYGFGLSLGVGYVTGLARNTTTSFAALTEMIQTDAGINPGVSGGPLVNIDGEVIGIGASRRADADGIGFVTPIGKAVAALPAMIDAERRYGFALGMTVAAVGEAAVESVAASGPAAEAGVERGDVVAAVDDKPVRRGLDFHLALVDRKGGQKLRLKLLRDGKGRKVVVTLRDVPMRPADRPGDLTPGLGYRSYKGKWDRLPEFAKLEPASSGTMATVGPGPLAGEDHFALVLTGHVDIPADGVWVFYLASDDGSRLYVGKTLVVDHDGLHGLDEKRGIVRLRAGKHRIRVEFFEAGGDEGLTLRYEGPGLRKRPIPAKALFHARPTSAPREEK